MKRFFLNMVNVTKCLGEMIDYAIELVDTVRKKYGTDQNKEQLDLLDKELHEFLKKLPELGQSLGLKVSLGEKNDDYKPDF